VHKNLFMLKWEVHTVVLDSASSMCWRGGCEISVNVCTKLYDSEASTKLIDILLAFLFLHFLFQAISNP
jgi:hypothetical protein